MGFPSGSWVKNLPASAGEAGDPGLPLGREDPLEEEVASTPLFWAGEFREQESLLGCGPWGCKSVGRDLALEHTLAWYGLNKNFLLYIWMRRSSKSQNEPARRKQIQSSIP